MRGCHGVHVVNLAVRSAPVMVRRSIPTGDAGFHQNGLGVEGNVEEFFILALILGCLNGALASRVAGRCGSGG